MASRAALQQVDSRRLPGPNLFLPGAGAILDVAGPAAAIDALIDRWQVHARALLDAVGWSGRTLAHRRFGGGASLVLSAPIDALYAATEINEAAFAAAVADVDGRGQAGADRTADVARLVAKIVQEKNPRLLALRDACLRHGVAFVRDDARVSIGLGSGHQAFDPKELPDEADVDWTRVHDVPVGLVTGTNGKSTTVRLLGAMARAQGLVPGLSTTDWVKVGDAIVERGDYSGPGGARRVLRDPQVEVAILETARGGMLRRGLVLARVDVAAICNVTADHLGEFGVTSMDDLVDAKLVVRRAVPADGLLVLNAEDPLLVARAPQVEVPIGWFSRDPELPHLRAHLESGGDAAVVEGGDFVLWRDGRRERIAAVVDAPITLNGAARHNVANILTALLVASRLGIDARAMAEGLRRFGGDPDENPGRCNVVEFWDVQAIVDFAHNPDGMKVILDMASALPATRRLLIIGQAGDRDDAAIREFARVAAGYPLDRIIIKEMQKYLRGRAPGIIPAMIEEELLRCGVPAGKIVHARSELEAVDLAFAWAEPGDLLLLLTHSDRAKVFARLEQFQQEGFPGRGP